MRSQKSMMIFVTVILLGLISACAYAFDYERYAIRMREQSNGSYSLRYERINGARNGSQDKGMLYCAPTARDRTPCIMIPRDVLEKLQNDYVDLQRELDRCRR